MSPRPGPTFGQLFNAPGVNALFVHALASILGMSLQVLALSVLVYEATGSAAWSSLAFAAGFLPQVVGGMFLTSLADRWPARRVLIAGGLIRSGLAFLLAATQLAPAIAILLVALVAVIQPLPQAVQAALVSRLAPGQLYVLARSVFNTVSSTAQLLGLALGGIATAAVGVRGGLLVAGSMQLLAALLAAALPALPPAASTSRWRPSSTWVGNARLLRDRNVRSILISWWVPLTLLVGAQSVVVPFVAETGASTASSGLLLATFPAGAALGNLIVGRLFPPHVRHRSTPWLCALMGVGLLPAAIDPGTVVTLVGFLIGAAGTSFQLGQQQAFVDRVPQDRHGLAFGLFSTGLMTGQGIGPLVAGFVADRVGAAAAISAIGLAVLVLAPLLARPSETPSTPRP